MPTGPGAQPRIAALRTDDLDAAGVTALDAIEEAPPLNFFGPLSGNMGLGVAARDWLRFLLESGIEVFAVDVPDHAGRSGHDGEFAHISHGLDEPAPHARNLFALNPWGLRRLAAAGHRAIRMEGRLNAILPFWELPRIPEDWRPGLEDIDVVLAPTRFVAEALRNAGCVREVEYVPHPPPSIEASVRDRKAWGIDEDAFLVVSSFELSSDIERKNPAAVIEAFGRAFPRDPRARLILKLNNGNLRGRFGPQTSRLSALAARDPRIQIRDVVLPYRDVLSLYASADVYVSLHRAEGLGLGMLEAMALGTPVVATGWSGNLDFMDAESAFLVDYELVPVRASTQIAYSPEVIGPDARWAEPDVAQAAALLRSLAADPGLGRARSARALRSLALRRERTQLSGFYAALRRAGTPRLRPQRPGA